MASAAYRVDSAPAVAGSEERGVDDDVRAKIDAVLRDMRQRGRRALRIVDLGCGAGGGLIAIAKRARELGFTAIEGLGVDRDPDAIERAWAAALVRRDPAIGLTFSLGSIDRALADENEEGCDLLLCLGRGLADVDPGAVAGLVRAMLLCADAAAFVMIGSGDRRRVIEALPLRPR
jgi:SAM-dependent methyltransferase